MSHPASLEALGRACAATAALVNAVQSDQWSNATPCAEWNARALINHLVRGNRMAAALLRGEQPSRPGSTPPATAAEQLGDDPFSAYSASASELQAAFSRPNVLDGVYQAPVGPVPGATLLDLRITELLVHGWDLAQATGQPARLPEDLAEVELAFARGDRAPRVPRTGHPFGPIQPVPDDAPAIDRLAAYLGRSIPSDSGPA
ncbi:MAG: TIGR03086 family protein [Chloroflexi bacterium]|nr:TIGR03086 family protein [Chloroflexota bacterium]